jgi:hypothetical protein
MATTGTGITTIGIGIIVTGIGDVDRPARARDLNLAFVLHKARKSRVFQINNSGAIWTIPEQATKGERQ